MLMGDDFSGVSSSSSSTSVARASSASSSAGSGLSGTSGSSGSVSSNGSSQSYQSSGKKTSATTETSGLGGRLDQVSQSAATGSSSGSGSGSGSQTAQKETGAGNGGMEGGISWSEGKSRKLIKPSEPDIQLSDASKKKIESNLKLTISFSVNEAGDVPLESIKVSPALQWPDVVTDIQQYISRNWRFESSNSKGIATFTFIIKVK